ncbi:putative F-box protein At3g23960 [Silene latifolia]|uniref:putative F-box protein At3g23960 n=1 Tax=Silene latifolia TaxID=37657 RepID=UPI003D77BAC6
MAKKREKHASKIGITGKLSMVILRQKHASNSAKVARTRFKKKRKRTIGGYFGGLPCETLHKIALMLPFTSIIQLRRSSKFWYNRLTEPKFIDLHLTRALQKPPGYLFTPNYECSQGRREIYTVEQSGGHISTSNIFEYSIKWEANKRNKFQSSGGLMCVYSTQSNCFRIFNPNIAEEIQVHNVPVFKKCRHWWFFSYSPSTKEYEILKIGVLLRNNNIESTVGSICTVGSNNWRKIKKNIPHQQDFNYVAECQGNLFWIKNRSVVWFDLASEEFHVIPGPPRDDTLVKGPVRPCAGILIAHLINMGHTVGCIQDYRLWMLEDKTKGIWISRYEFSNPLLYRNLHIAGVSENGGLFGFIRRSANLFRQDMGCTEVEKISLDDSFERIAYVAPHVRSFVSPLRILELGNKQISDQCDVTENVPDLTVADSQAIIKRRKLKKRQR